MTRKRALLLGLPISCLAAAALDYGAFVISGLLLLAEPANFQYDDSSFTVMHYQFHWGRFLIEAAFLYGLLALIMSMGKRRKKRKRSS